MRFILQLENVRACASIWMSHKLYCTTLQHPINKISQYFHSQPIAKAWVFGSYARSEEDSKSDIDILVNFMPGEKITLFQYIHMVNDLQALTGKRIDLVEDGQLKKCGA